MTIQHDEHWYVCDDCDGAMAMAVNGAYRDADGDLVDCAGCTNGYIEGDDDDCEASPCDVATGALTL